MNMKEREWIELLGGVALMAVGYCFICHWLYDWWESAKPLLNWGMES